MRGGRRRRAAGGDLSPALWQPRAPRGETKTKPVLSLSSHLVAFSSLRVSRSIVSL
jgi:hypothetical protein